MPPVASPLFIEAQTAHEALSRRIRDWAKKIKTLQDFATLAEDQEREIERVQVKQWVNELYDELSRIKSDSRAALLASKRAIDSDARSRRDELLGSAALQQKRAAKPKLTSNAPHKLMAASDDVTEALRRTTRLMQQELERSVLSTQMLQESSKTLRSTTDVYVNLDNLMDVSQVLIKALQRADWMDRIIIGLSFTVFLLTMAYIVKRRVLDRVVTVATLPLRLMGAGSSKVTTTEDMLTETTRTIKTLATSLTNTVQTAISASIPTTLDSLPTSSVREAVLDTVESAIETSLDPDIYTRICSDGICEFAESMTSIIADATSTVAFSVLPTVASLPHEEL
ncbi:Sec20 protein [Rhizoctonia solani]|uniref:Sec20 protein n=1 Tax=Rhizoctonia solani TaxID=456999 RepID=A0A8H7IBF5_9AGAM|nr:Sec20 protein [Rhizoctonia solani]